MTDSKMANRYKTGLKMWFKNWMSISCPWLVKANIVVLLFLPHLTSLATYTDPTTRTNVNKVDPLLSEKIEDYKDFEQDLEEQKASAVKGVESEVGVNDLGGGNDEVRAKVSNLSNIRAEELEEAGAKESVKEPWINECLLDYSKPGMIQHKEDAAIIANETGKMLDGLIGILKKLDIDCKQVKGNKEVEPQYYIQSALELDRSKGDSIYDKVICDELRNKYHCTDTITLKCIKKGGSLKEAVIRITDKDDPIIGTTTWWETLWNNTEGDPGSLAVRDLPWMKIRESDQVTQLQMKQRMAKKLGISADSIVSVSWKPKKSRLSFGMQHLRIFEENFLISYKDGPDKCVEWQESLDERCKLQ